MKVNGMDCAKVGALIKGRRIERQMTQKQLADAMNISDKMGKRIRMSGRFSITRAG